MTLPARIQQLLSRAVKGRGAAPTALRRAVFERARKVSQDPPTRSSDLPAEIEAWTTKVARNAYKTLDREVDAMRAAGFTDDHIFEITVCAALGAGAVRLEAGLKALDELDAEPR